MDIRPAPPAEVAASTGADVDDGYKWKAFTAVAISFVTIVMSMSMVFVALSDIAADFDVTLRAVSWVVIAQALTITALMLPMGRLADIIGRRRVHLIGLTFFAAGAMCCALAPSLAALIVALVVMSVGNSMAQSVGSAMVVSVFPAHERGTAIGSQTTAVAVGAALGPVVAGLALEVMSWRALFVLVAIPVVVALVVGARILDEARVTPDRGTSRVRFDVTGALICAAAVTVIVITVSNPFAASWLSAGILAGAVTGALLLGAFVWWELRVESPMLEMRLFRNPVLASAIATRLFGFMASTANQLLLPVYLISYRGIRSGHAGLFLFLFAVGLGLASQTCGRLGDRLGERPFVTLGFSATLVTLTLMSMLHDSTPLSVVAVVVFFNGVAMGTWSVPNNSILMGSLPRPMLGVAGALSNLTRNVGSVLGQAIGSAVVAASMVTRGFDVALDEIDETPGAGAAFIDGWQNAFFVAVGLSAAGLALNLATRSRRAH